MANRLVPPSAEDAGIAIFPYASFRLAFHRLSSALAFESRGTSITVWIGCPTKQRVVSAPRKHDQPRAMRR